jgi:hypothetical protein
MAEVQQSIVKTHLVQQIDNLKNDIQLLIDYKKTIENKDEISKCNQDKQRKITQLKNLTDKLKNIHKQEKMVIQKQNELRSLSRAIDNIEFGGAKKKNNPLVMEKAKLEKAKREKTRNQYLEYQMIEKKYLEYDSKTLPGNLFLHNDVLKSYGLCPFIDINTTEITETTKTTETTETTEIEKLRLNWLQSQNDKGEIYTNLYNNLINKKDLNLLQNESQKLETDIYEFTKDILSSSQMELYDNSVNFIKEYTNCHIKTKRIKEKYKLFINNLSILYSETNIEFHTYLSLLFNTVIVVNIINSQSDTNNQNKLDKIMKSERFYEYITEYKSVIENKEKIQRYITNTIRNLNENLHLFLTDKKSFFSNQDISIVKKSNIIQKGKYFKRWILLTKEEHLERFLSYSTYYVDKFLIEKSLISSNDKDVFTSNLYNILKDAFESKKMIYRDYCWNTKRGMIESIKILKFTENKEFILSFTKKENKGAKADKEKKKAKKIKKSDTNNNNTDTTTSVNETTTNVNTSLNNETTNESLNDATINVNDTTTSVKSEDVQCLKKKVSIRTIITKESEKIINEELLYYILKKSETNSETPSKQDKDDFTERIKTKLKIKKLNLNDKLKIYEKYDEIFKVIKNNR